MENIQYEERYAAHPDDVKNYGTERLRNDFLIDKVFEEGKIRLVYTHYDRFITGGAMPVDEILSLDTIDPLKADHFCDRREVGIINIGGKGTVTVDAVSYELKYKEALYIGKGSKVIQFKSIDASAPAMFFMNSTPAHQAYATKKITIADAIVMDLGKPEEANERQIIQYIVSAIVETCQLQMGITQLKSGNIWNTMPPHTHNRRMEVYFYTDLAENQAICHFMGRADETRHIWMKNNQAVVSPPWSIHSAAGTSSYSFIWGMAGENLDFTDMDAIKTIELK